MKRTILILIGIVCACACFAQSRPQVLIGDRIEAISGFGGPMFQFTVVDKKVAVMTGGGGAVIFNNMMYFGGYGMSLATDLERTRNGEEYDIDYNHGGFMLGYIFDPNSIFHLGLSTKLGWGDIRIDNKDANSLESTDYDNIFVFGPQLEGEINVTQWFKLNGAIGYNGVIGVSNDIYKPIDFNRPQVSLSLLFGWFY